MSILSQELAQDIVKRTMKIIPYNVNVMDAQGTILASGDSKRLGELHSGALLALAKKTVVEIDAATEKNMHGAKSGVNLPLSVNATLCGAVGISGKPDEVRQFGELVRLTAEMILEQSLLISELQRNSHYHEAFLLNVIRSESSSDADILSWGQRLNFHFERTHLIFLLEFNAGYSESIFTLKQQIQTHLSSAKTKYLTAKASPGGMIILDTYDTPKNNKTTRALPEQRLHALSKTIAEVCKEPHALAMGIALPGLQGIRISYQSAKTSYKLGIIQHPASKIYNYYERALPVLLSGSIASWQAEQLRLPFMQLRQQDKTNAMLETTLRTWFAQNENLVSTAKALNIHRNSLDYRLKRIEQITRFNLSKTEDRFLLYVSSVLCGG